jgi:light-regulated signal transduction histidine kinase (bacteriophytochrome)
MTPESAPFERALAQCAREPIHVIGAVQPPGVLVAYHRHDHRILAASANAVDLFECRDITALLHQRFDQLVDDSALAAINAVLARGEAGMSQFAGTTNVGPLSALYDLSTHASGPLVHVELEPAGQGLPLQGGHALVAALDAAADSRGFLDKVARQVQRISGYGRVMVYRFLPDFCGEVVAEALAGGLASYDGLRYPASDIPPQARALYLRNRLRVIADVDAAPQPVLQSTELDGPLDMSFDVLRAVSPVHLQYLRNMGVRASMSISLVVDGRLWGLVACHHDAPRPLDARQRVALDMVGRHVSMILDAQELRARARGDDACRARRDALEVRLHAATDARAALAGALDLLAGAVPADGVALRLGDAWHCRGDVPDADGLQRALQWALEHGRPGTSATHDGRAWHPQPPPQACGLLASPLGQGGAHWLLLFRKEQRQTLRWAGRPDRPFQLDPDGTRIGPRASFEAWEEEVEATSAPWSERDIDLVQRVRLVLERYVAGHAPRTQAQDESDAPMRGWDAREHAARLRRLAELLDGTYPDRERLQRMGALLAQMEAELGAMAGALD